MRTLLTFINTSLKKVYDKKGILLSVKITRNCYQIIVNNINYSILFSKLLPKKKILPFLTGEAFFLMYFEEINFILLCSDSRFNRFGNAGIKTNNMFPGISYEPC